MSKKITEKEFVKRFLRFHPTAKIKLLNYTAISNSLSIQCKRCGKISTKPRARDFLSSFPCCEDEKKSRIEMIKEVYADNNDFEFVKQLDRNYYLVYHRKCNQYLKRTGSGILDNPYSCSHCKTIKTSNMLSIEEVQNKIDERFYGAIQILDYNGQLEKNHYRCLKCGLIFVQKQICLMQSRGCPKCDRYTSKGEKEMEQILEKNKIIFKKQVPVPELPLQRFDFAVYNNKEEISYFIEIQGEQHYKDIPVFRDSLEKIKIRDKKKREYCKEREIPLYEIINKKGKLQNLDILPFGSTTISVKESTS